VLEAVAGHPPSNQDALDQVDGRFGVSLIDGGHEQRL
jgi:hypothetical protein